MIKFCSLVCLSLLINCTIWSQSGVAPKYSNEFLSIGVGADALGQGKAVVASTQSSASGYWNPAGLIGVNKWLDVTLMHSEYFAGIAKYDYLGLSHTIDERSALGFSAIRFAVDDIPNTTQLIDNNGNIDYDRISLFTAADYGFLFSYARKSKIPNLNLGGNAKIIHRKVGDFAKSWGFGFDFGAQYTWREKWKFGAVMRDATSTFNGWMFTLDDATKAVFAKTGNEIPENGLELTLPRLILGSYRKFDLGKKGIYLSSEVNADITTDRKRNTLISSNFVSIDPYMGLSVGFKELVHVRAGLSTLQYVKQFDDSRKLNVQPSLGIGFKVKSFALDYAFTDIGDVSAALYSHVISVRLQLNEPKNVKTSPKE